MKKMVRRESIKPSSKTGMAKAPMANEETTILAESHYSSSRLSDPLLVKTEGGGEEKERDMVTEKEQQ